MSFTESLPLDLQKQIKDCISSYPETEQAFYNLYEYFQINGKKRKISNIDSESSLSCKNNSTTQPITSLKNFHIILQLPDLSVLSPLRKKLNFIFASKNSNNKQTPILALTRSIEDGAPEMVIDDLSKENIKFATLLPIPEKKNVKYLIFFYNKNAGNLFKNEPLLIQLNFENLNEQWLPILAQLKYNDLTSYLQRQCQICGFELNDPFNDKKSKSFYVEAYKGSKEGQLYFLPNHIIFGFKKPILFFQSTDIESITYSSITRITFNVTLVLNNDEKFEFSMIDQKDFENIDQYVKTKEFRDKSMTDELKAKKFSKNNDHEGILKQLEETETVSKGLDENENEDSDDDEDDDNFQFNEEESDSGGSGASSESEEENEDNGLEEEEDSGIEED
ncbi:hypothetical protein PACTADRAFT_49439 [Pachysolen tannophilus NRRL Y-2460]|uniref:Histone chaperone RTT106 n=1 Tax=Pachysolen tannophilus NRRL Y-2460 TaxID=669874 RepID=A0A1E4TWB1_PACTA|nr:hypothetical protein PACTADRAFT_49439 [Pachysolen tannophilus NRRL Y-2460]